MKKSCAYVIMLAAVLCFCGQCCAQQEKEIPPADKLYRIGLVSMQKGDYANAKPALTMLIFHYPDDPRQGVAHLVLAQVYLHESDFFAAKLALERVVEKYADSKDSNGKSIMPTALTYLGAIYSSMGADDAARQVYGRLEKEYPDAVDMDGEKFVNAIPERFRSGASRPGTPSTPPQSTPDMDDAAKKRAYADLQDLLDKARGEATKLYPKSLAKRKEHVTKKTESAYGQLAAKYKTSSEAIQAIEKEGKARGW